MIERHSIRGRVIAALIFGMLWLIGCSQRASTPAPSAIPLQVSPASLRTASTIGSPESIDEILASLADLPFNAFLEESFKQLTLRDPEAITEAGVAAELGVRNDRLSDLSEDYLLDTQALQRGILDLLHGYSIEDLNSKETISWEVYEWYLDDLVRGQEFMYYDYPLHHFIGSYHDELVRLFTEFQPMATTADAQDYVSRLRQVDRQVDQLLEGLRVREELGIVPPDFILAMARSQMLDFMGTRSSDPSSIDPQSNPLYEAFEAKLESIAGLNDEQRDRLIAEALEAMNESVVPAYLKLLDYLEHLQQIAGSEAGVWRFPEGEEYYRYMLRKETSTEMTPGEVHELGLAEVERIRGEMRQVFLELNYPAEEDFGSLLERAIGEAGFYSTATSSGDQELLVAYEALLEAMELLLEPAFDLRPRATVEVIGDPDFVGGGYYTPPSVDGTRPGHFHTGIGGSRAWKYSMPTVAYHEAIPGHHFQIAIAQEMQLPSFQQHVIFNGYAEGWALYAERLAKELGAYDQDPYGDIGRLQLELLRAVRLVTDTGIHTMGWSREEARAYMNQALGDRSGSFAHEVDRYIVWPAQATGYKIGMQKLLKLRQEAMDRLGDEFDLAEFHNVVLGSGSLPLEVLEGLVDRYIAEKLES